MGGGIKSRSLFDEIISLKNLFLAWKEFKKGKAKKQDVKKFSYDFRDNIFYLHNKLKNKTYKHLTYHSFYIKDPKLRHIHKAVVKDRVLHHAVFKILYRIFDKSFIFDSYSCRIGKGTHRAVNRLNYFSRKVSRNNTRACFVLKCDVRKFFDSINHNILINLIKKKITDKNTIWLITKIIESYSAKKGIGLPLGNITSQLFANIYLNELDRFIKHSLRARYYIRYCDDFVILDNDKDFLKNLIFPIADFLKRDLRLSLHPDKISIKRYRNGIDFLGFVSFPCHRILRTKTGKRMFKRLRQKCNDLKSGEITKEHFNQALQSYLGMMKHCNSYKLEVEIKKYDGFL